MPIQLKGEDIPFEIVLFTSKYKNAVKDFDCGNEVINQYLTEQAYDDINAVTYLVINSDNKEVIGFISLCCSGIRYTTDESFHVTLPAVEIKYFAIINSLHKLVFDDTDDHFYFSDKVLCEVLRMCRDISERIIGARYILLYAVDSAVRFYERNLFTPYTEFMSKDKIRFLDGCTPMFMEL